MADEAARAKWDARYRDSHSDANAVAEVLRRNATLLPQEGIALDLACGLGGNALFLAEMGLDVYAWDISPVAIDRLDAAARQRGLTLHAAVRDCVADPPEPNRFDIIVICRFLDRALCLAIAAALKPGGLLFYQTFMQERLGNDGPRNPRFLLAPDELRELFSELDVIVYEEGDEAMLVARKV